MPYIKPHKRNAQGAGVPPHTPGELNYAITKLLLSYIGHAPNYDAINEVVGVLECAKLELYRRVAVPYEDVKCKENGDVY